MASCDIICPKVIVRYVCLDKANAHSMYGTTYDRKFGHHLSFFFFFLNIQNQSPAGNVIQLNYSRIYKYSN